MGLDLHLIPLDERSVATDDKLLFVLPIADLFVLRRRALAVWAYLAILPTHVPVALYWH